MPEVYLGLGANLGNRRANLVMALRGLTRMSRLEAVSSLYETAPQPPAAPAQPNFYNAACRIETGLEPLPLLRFLQALEHEIGRRPSAERWVPRVIDIDILLYGDRTIGEEALHVPHSRMTERAFVLAPLAEIAAEARHPGTGETIAALAEKLDASGVTRIAEGDWHGVQPGARLRL